MELLQYILGYYKVFFCFILLPVTKNLFIIVFDLCYGCAVLALANHMEFGELGGLYNLETFI